MDPEFFRFMQFFVGQFTLSSQIYTDFHIQHKMSKRTAEDIEEEGVSLRNGERPVQPPGEDEAGQFEDDYEDVFEEEIFEAGVDGRPDDEREAEELAGMDPSDYAATPSQRLQRNLCLTERA